jgi:Fur family transcriptional regulator, peroxide stress response regulator
MPKKPKPLTYRKSKQRDQLLKLLHSTDLHPTADWLYDKMKKKFPRLSLGTVYRNLGILIEQGLVRKLHYGSTFDRFEARVVPHCHLICECCGRISDFEMPLHADLNMEASARTDFAIAYHKIDFFGQCATCQKRS